MARDFNQNRIANAILKSKSGINSTGVFYAVEDGADGYNVVVVESLPEVGLFIGQNTELHDAITEWTLFNNQETYGGIGANAFARFPNLGSITIYQDDLDDVMTIDDNAFASNPDIDKIYVNPNKLAEYQSAYSGKVFASYFLGYNMLEDWTIPTQYNGNIAPTTLTKEWIDLVTADLPLALKNVKTNIFVPTSYFESVEVGAFRGIANIFVNATDLKFDGTISLPSGFLNGASWCKHIWMANGSSTIGSPYITDATQVYEYFRIVAPYNQFQNYFMQEHNLKTGVVCSIIGYKQFVSGASMDVESATGTYAWFSNIDFNTTPETLEDDPSFISTYIAPSSGNYYCYDKTSTLVVQGSGALTSAIVEASILGLNTPKSWITKLVIPNTFTLNTTASASSLDPIDTYLPNCISLEINSVILNQYNSSAILYSNWGNANCKFVNVIYNAPTLPSMAFVNAYIKYFESETITLVPYENTFAGSKLEDIKVPNVTVVQRRCFANCSGFANKELLFENLEDIEDAAFNGSIDGVTAKLYLPKVNALNEPFGRINSSKFFFGADTINFKAQLVGQPNYRPGGAYFKANKLVDFFTNSMLDQWKTYCRYGIIGVIDDADVYTNLKNRGVSMGYPKLTGIDTETNIQLLTPSDGALYLANDTGNLWKYESGSWTNLFSGYTPTWYTDEECTTTIQTNNITASMTVYVKLTAI